VSLDIEKLVDAWLDGPVSRRWAFFTGIFLASAGWASFQPTWGPAAFGGLALAGSVSLAFWIHSSSVSKRLISKTQAGLVAEEQRIGQLALQTAAQNNALLQDEKARLDKWASGREQSALVAALESLPPSLKYRWSISNVTVAHGGEVRGVLVAVRDARFAEVQATITSVWVNGVELHPTKVERSTAQYTVAGAAEQMWHFECDVPMAKSGQFQQAVVAGRACHVALSGRLESLNMDITDVTTVVEVI
jgi:hypothetical protein